VGASVERLERDIERTRAELAETLAMIEDKIRPQRILRDHRTTLAAVAGGIVALMTVIVVRRARARW
jgi:glutathione S-transferase